MRAGCNFTGRETRSPGGDASPRAAGKIFEVDGGTVASNSPLELPAV
jgi:hypothetical protein